MHALVPGGGPAINKDRWIETRHPKQRRRRKPYLVNNRLLSERFCELFIAGVERLQRRGELQVDDSPSLRSRLAALRSSPWVVYIEAPPHQDASPEHVLKYLARYLTGGPISDQRLVSHKNDQVTFLARSNEKPTDGRLAKQVPVSMSGVEFVRCWLLHILPKGFTKVRRYGGLSNRHRESYLQRCRDLLTGTTHNDSLPARPDEKAKEITESLSPCCPTCCQPLVCTGEKHRPSWRVLMSSPLRPPWYLPIHPRAG